MQHNRENQLRITDLEKWTFNIQHQAQAAEPAATFFPGPLPLVIPNFTTPPFVILPVLYVHDLRWRKKADLRAKNPSYWYNARQTLLSINSGDFSPFF